MRVLRTMLLVLAVVSALGSPAPAPAQEKLEVRDTDTVKTTLERYVGKRVSLVTRAGSELTGTVVKVGDHVVHLGELAGREFFDAVVSLDQVQAVIVRTRGR